MKKIIQKVDFLELMKNFSFSDPHKLYSFSHKNITNGYLSSSDMPLVDKNFIFNSLAQLKGLISKHGSNGAHLASILEAKDAELSGTNYGETLQKILQINNGPWGMDYYYMSNSLSEAIDHAETSININALDAACKFSFSKLTIDGQYNELAYTHAKRGGILPSDLLLQRKLNALNKNAISNHDILIQDNIKDFIMKLFKTEQPYEQASFRKALFNELEGIILPLLSSPELQNFFAVLQELKDKMLAAELITADEDQETNNKLEEARKYRDHDCYEFFRAYIYFIKACAFKFDQEYLTNYKLDVFASIEDVWLYYWPYLQRNLLDPENGFKNICKEIANAEIDKCGVVLLNTMFEASYLQVDGVDIFDVNKHKILTEEAIRDVVTKIAITFLQDKATDSDLAVFAIEPKDFTNLQLCLFAHVAKEIIDNSRKYFDLPNIPIQALIYAQECLMWNNFKDVLGSGYVVGDGDNKLGGAGSTESDMVISTAGAIIDGKDDYIGD